MSKCRVAINGAGRIGRLVLRAYFENRARFPDLELIAINDPHEIDTLIHLLRYDSVHGPFHAPIDYDGRCLVVAGTSIELRASRDPSALDWGALGVDYVLECTGCFKNKEDLTKHIDSGAKRVVLASPGGEGVATCVLGVNEHVLPDLPEVYSIGSCTTNAIAPVLQIMHDQFGVEEGFMTTVHAYTNDQCLVDSHHKDLRRARAACGSIIPTKTGAADGIGKVIPSLEGKLKGYALRVPTANVSVVDLALRVRTLPSKELLKKHLIQAASVDKKGILAVSDALLVSCDFNHHIASAVVDMTLLDVVGEMIKLVIWYDNEWGFANRLLDVVQQQYTILHVMPEKSEHAAV